jgi:methionyl-tRNA formyltransferase
MVTSGVLRVVFFGTPEFAVPTLDALLSSRHAVAAVVTQPDRPRGRGQKTVDAPVKRRAVGAAVPVLQPTSLKDPAFVDALHGLHADLGVVAAYGRILTEAVLAVPRLGMINVHASLLPRWRGAAPVHRAVIAGDRETGVTIMRVVKALDAGAMIADVRRPIGGDETSADVERDLARLGATLLVSVVDRLAEGPIEERPQDDAAATYAPRLQKEEGAIDWDQPARDIHNHVRGLHPWPLAFSYLNGRRVIVRRTAVASMDTAAPSAVPSTVLTARPDDFLVAAGRGALRIVELQAEGKRPITAREFLAGHRVSPGDRFMASP